MKNTRNLFLAILSCLAGLAALATTSCSSPSKKSPFTEHRVTRQHEAGSIHFAVLAVAPWEYYIDALQPHFPIDETMALQQVVPATRTMENSMLDIAKVRVGFESADTEDRPVGAINPAAAGSSIDMVTNRPLRDTNLPPPHEIDPNVSLDPMTKYWAATAFYQEVQLLSRYVQDAAVRKGFRPFLVRVQVSLMPSARNEPYDAYCTLSFFCEEGQGDFAPMTIRSPLKDSGGGAAASKKRIALPSQSASPASERGAAHVLPLMVTDNLEASIQSSTMQSLRQAAATLSFISGTATGGVDAEKINNDLQQVMGSDLNSLLTVARVSDNTLRVRLGAMQQASAKYAMVPRNHNITLLLMVPEDADEVVRVIAKSTMVDAVTGYELPDRDPQEFDSALARIMRSHEITDISPKAIRPLVQFAQANDQRAYDRAFRRLFADDSDFSGYKDTLWLDLVTLMIGNQYSATEFDLPSYDPDSHRGTELIPHQTAVVQQGPGRSTVATLSANDLVDARNWNASLELQQPAGNIVVVPSNGIFVDPLSGYVTCTFPPHPLSYMTDSPTGEVTLIISDRSHERRFGAAWGAPGGGYGPGPR